ncbi:MAG: serine hydrolase [Cyanobacteria bacterium RI_101]|nr:serine hydrolase [Cyanobacteria bacterium RI_101]
MPFFTRDPDLTDQGTSILEQTWRAFPSLAPDQIAVTWLAYDEPVIVNTGGALTPEDFWRHPLRGFSYRGNERVYPASVVKLFYLVALAEWFAKGMVETTAELERAMADMIVESSNDATSLVVDALTGTTSGPVLPAGPFATWQSQRNLVNRYFQSLGWEELAPINVNQKTWGDGPYGRERVFVGELYENRNMLTTDACARLLHSIVGGVAVSPEACRRMMALLERNLSQKAPAPGEENQVTGFLGAGLDPDAKLWSKAGWMSRVRHDCAYIEPPQGRPYLLTVFTEGAENAANPEILPFISRAFADAQP